VRAMAVWALMQLDPARAVTLRPAHAKGETDIGVLAEWTLAA
jgi:hypothetical protein